MEEKKNDFTTIDEYIAQFSSEVQEKLQLLRKVIRESAPDAAEKISWKMATFDLHGNLVHFAAYKNHIGFYPGASGMANFDGKMLKYKRSKGAVQFPIDQPLPYDLIGEIVRFRVDENRMEAERKLEKKKK